MQSIGIPRLSYPFINYSQTLKQQCSNLFQSKNETAKLLEKEPYIENVLG